MRKVLGLVVVMASLGAGLAWADNAQASSRREYREAIRSMPILERPNRFGHIYGNTVRRVYQRRHGGLPGHNDAGLPAENALDHVGPHSATQP